MIFRTRLSEKCFFIPRTMTMLSCVVPEGRNRDGTLKIMNKLFQKVRFKLIYLLLTNGLNDIP